MGITAGLRFLSSFDYRSILSLIPDRFPKRIIRPCNRSARGVSALAFSTTKPDGLRVFCTVTIAAV
jgi:hypothetical protein